MCITFEIKSVASQFTATRCCKSIHHVPHSDFNVSEQMGSEFSRHSSDVYGGHNLWAHLWMLLENENFKKDFNGISCKCEKLQQKKRKISFSPPHFIKNDCEKCYFCQPFSISWKLNAIFLNNEMVKSLQISVLKNIFRFTVLEIACIHIIISNIAYIESNIGVRFSSIHFERT